MRLRHSIITLTLGAVAAAAGHAQIATATQLIASTQSPAAREIVTLKAVVTPVTANGTVVFTAQPQNAQSYIIGTAQLVNGTAIEHAAFAYGVPYSVTATYRGTTLYATSKQNISVSVNSAVGVQAAVASSLTNFGPDPYTATATVGAFGLLAAQGTLTFNDTTNHQVLASSAVTTATNGFLPATTVGAGSQIVTGDLRGIGIQDLIGTGSIYLSAPVACQQNVGDPTFGVPPSSNCTGQVIQCSSPDRFGNENCTEYTAPPAYQVCVNLGNGDGTFANKSCTTVQNSQAGGGGTLIHPVVGDFNSDGYLDVAIAVKNDPSFQLSKNENGSIVLLFGNGTGTFPTQTTIYSGNLAGSSNIYVGDFNRDGNLDLVSEAPAITQNRNQGTPLVLFGNGDGTFAPLYEAQEYSVDSGDIFHAEETKGMVVGDFNGDGADDVAILYSGCLNGTGGDPAGDYNNNISHLQLYYGAAGSETLTDGPTITVTGSFCQNQGNLNMSSGLFSGNTSSLDLVTTVSDPYVNAATATPIQHFVNDGTGVFSFGGYYPNAPGLNGPYVYPCDERIIAGDFNADGKTDFVCLNGPYLYLGDGQGNYTIQPSLIPGTYPQGGGNGAGADFNADGRLDLVTDGAYIFLSVLGETSSANLFTYGSASSNVTANFEPAASSPYPAASIPIGLLDNLSVSYLATAAEGGQATPPAASLSAGQAQTSVEVTDYFHNQNTTSPSPIAAAPIGYVVSNNPSQVVVTGPNNYLRTYPFNLTNGEATFTPDTLDVAGTYTYTASFTDPNSLIVPAEAIATQVITAGPASKLVITTLYPSPTVVGTANGFTVTVEDQFGNPIATAPPAITISSTDASFTYTQTGTSGASVSFSGAFNQVGTWSLTASSPGLASATQNNIVVTKRTLTGASLPVLTSTPNPSTVHQAVALTVTFPALSPVPTGQISFYDAGTLLGTANLNGAGTATFSTSTLAIGTHPITASYGGDNNYNGATTNTLNQVVNAGPPYKLVITGLYPSPSLLGTSNAFAVTVEDQYGDPAYFTALPPVTITSSDATFQSTVSSVNGAVITYTGTFNQSGTWSITAASPGLLSGVQNNIVITKRTLTGANLPSLTSNPNPSSFSQGVLFSVTVPSLAPALTGTVTFYDGATQIGAATLVGTTASITYGGLSVGIHNITATYGGDSNYNGASTNKVVQVVNHASVTVTISGAPNPSTYLEAVDITVTVIAPAGGPVPTGTVSITNGGTALGTATLDATGKGTLTVSVLAVGMDTITGVYSGDANYQ